MLLTLRIDNKINLDGGKGCCNTPQLVNISLDDENALQMVNIFMDLKRDK